MSHLVGGMQIANPHWACMRDCGVCSLCSATIRIRLHGVGRATLFVAEAGSQICDEGRILNRKLRMGTSSGESELRPLTAGLSLHGDMNLLCIYMGCTAPPRLKSCHPTQMTLCQSPGVHPMPSLLYVSFCPGKNGANRICIMKRSRLS